MTKRNWVVGAAAVALTAGGIWWYGLRDRGPAYRTAPVDRGTVESSINATGNTNAVVSVQVGSQVSGNVKGLYANYNSHVAKGQLVAEIDPAPFQARVDQARAGLSGAHSAVMSAQAQVERSASDIASAQANEKAAQATIVKDQVTVADSKTKWDRREQMLASGIASVEDRDTAKLTYDAAVAELDAARSQAAAAAQAVASAQAQRKIAQEQLASAIAQEKAAQASLVQAQLDLEHTAIRAPVDGTVIARNVDVGQTVAASLQAPTLFQIAQDLTKMQVDTNVDEADIGRVKVGQEARFTVDAYAGRNFHGMVREIRQAPIVAQNVVTYDVVLGVSNDDLKLLPGMTANVRIMSDRTDNSLRVPNAALRFRPPAGAAPAANGVVHAARRNTQSVWVMTPDRSIEERTVTPGLSDGQFTAIAGGNLREGDQVVLGITSGPPASGVAAGTRASGGPRRGMGF
jgi:HlyD family secretion protein